MLPTRETRKPITSLTRPDLDAFPIWQFADEEGIDGQDETWVRPVDARAIPRRTETIVAAAFRAACGREFAGHITVSRLGEPADIDQGVICGEGRSWLIPNPGFVFFEQAMADLIDGLDLAPADLFPMTYTLRVPFDSEFACRGGILDGRKAVPDRPDATNTRQMSFW